MQVIPVVDVKNGRVVQAAGGRRESYEPLRTPFAATADPVSVAAGLCNTFDFDRIYLADLDGITCGVPDMATIERLAAMQPGVALWVDNGAASYREIVALAQVGNVQPVVGSETLREPGELRELIASCWGSRIALSLDFDGDVFRGPTELLSDPSLWPATVIVMTLGAVGGRRGPDLTRVADIRRRSDVPLIVAAGGVRHGDDLRALAQAGASAALVATALHTGTLKAGDLREVAGLAGTRS